MNSFLSTVRESIYSPSFYKSIGQRKFSFTLKYLAKLSFVVGVVFAIVSIPNISTVKIGIDSISEKYPEDLVIVLNNGEVVTNVEEPYAIPASEDLVSDEQSNLVVIDTEREATIDILNELSTFAFIGRDVLIIGESNSQIRIIPLQNLPNVTIDEVFISQQAERIKKMSTYAIPLFMLLGTFAGTFIVSLLQMILIALLILIALRIASKRISYRVAYKSGLHALTLGVVLDLFLGSFIGLALPVYVVFFLPVIVVLANLRKGLPKKRVSYF